MNNQAMRIPANKTLVVKKFPIFEFNNFWLNFEGIDFLVVRYSKTVYSDYNVLQIVVLNFCFSFFINKSL